MKYTLILKQILIGGILVIFQTGCNKFVEVDEPVDLLVTSSVFTNKAAAEAAMNGLYQRITALHQGIFNGGLSICAGMGADELLRSANPNDPFVLNQILPDNTNNFNNLWANAYQNIYHANAVIANLELSTALEDQQRIQLTGEARFIRAFYYFYLVNLYGDVPLAISPDYKINAQLKRAAASEVYAQILLDLQYARTHLTATYAGTKKVRAIKWAASALLARVYLYQQDWPNAALYADEVIEKGGYTLGTLENLFLANSSETILEFALSIDFSISTVEGYEFIPKLATTIPPYYLTTQLQNDFDPNDKRKTSWLRFNTVSGTKYYYPFKYKISSDLAIPRKENNIALRLAEQHLILAEALARQHKLTDAIDQVDVIRRRAELPLLSVVNPGINEQDLLAAIYRERQIEFFAEWGHRWFDLKRTGQINQVLGSLKATWKPTAALYPIPLSEITYNPFLVQNPGYE